MSLEHALKALNAGLRILIVYGLFLLIVLWTVVTGLRVLNS